MRILFICMLALTACRGTDIAGQDDQTNDDDTGMGSGSAEGNQAPVAIDDAVEVSSDATISIAVLGNDSDPDAEAIAIASVDGQSERGATVTDNGDSTVLYDPRAAFADLQPGASAEDTFEYRVKDAAGDTAEGTVRVTVKSINDAPLASADAATCDEDATALVAVLDKDSAPDAGDTLAVGTFDATSTLGGLVALEDKALRYTPPSTAQALAAGR